MRRTIGKIDDITRNKSLIRGSLFSLFSFLNKGLGFLLMIILANFITPSEYGYLNLFNTVIMVLMYFMAMSAEGYWGVAYFSEGKEGLKKTFTCVFFLTLLGAMLLSMLICAEGEWLEKKLNLSVPILYCAVAICFFTIYNQILLDNYRLQEKVIIYGLLSCGAAVLNFSVSVYLVKYCNLSWQGRVYAQLACTTVFGVGGFLYFVGKRYLTTHFLHYLKPLLLWSLPLIPHTASNFFRQGCDRYIIDAFHSIEDVGLFSFALTLSTIVTMIGAGFNQSNSVDIYKILGNETMNNEEKLEMLGQQRRLYKWIYRVAAMSIVIICFIVVPVIMPKYAGALQYVPILTIFGYFTCIYFLWTNYLFYYKRTKQIMYITFGSSIIHLMFSLILTRYSLFITASLYALTQFLVAYLIKRMAIDVLNKELQLLS